MKEGLRFEKGLEPKKIRDNRWVVQLLLIGGLLTGMSLMRDGEKEGRSQPSKSEKENSYRPPSLPPLDPFSEEKGTGFPSFLEMIPLWNENSTQETAEARVNRYMPFIEAHAKLDAEKLEEFRKRLVDLVNEIPLLSIPDASIIVIKEWLEEQKIIEKMKEKKEKKSSLKDLGETTPREESAPFQEEKSEEEIFGNEELLIPEIRLQNQGSLFKVELKVTKQGQMMYIVTDTKDVFKTKEFDRLQFIQATNEILENAKNIERLFVLKEKIELSYEENKELSHLIEKLQEKLSLMEFKHE